MEEKEKTMFEKAKESLATRIYNELPGDTHAEKAKNLLLLIENMTEEDREEALKNLDASSETGTAKEEFQEFESPEECIETIETFLKDNAERPETEALLLLKRVLHYVKSFTEFNIHTDCGWNLFDAVKVLKKHGYTLPEIADILKTSGVMTVAMQRIEY